MARYLITGVTGTLGQEVMKKLLLDCHEVVGYSRDELKQSLIPKDPKLTLYLGDVRNRERMIEASRGVDVIFHFAALKRIDSMEENPEECIETNVVGTQNVLSAQRLNRIRRVVLSSTDKAAHPETVYGASKLMAERLVLRNPNNVVCRYGNVLASRGSVIVSFIDSIIKEKTIYITDPEMTRFFLTAQEASHFVTRSAFGEKGGLKIPKLKACKIIDLAHAIADVLGVDKPKMKIIGVRGIEKTHEILTMPCDGGIQASNMAIQLTKSEIKRLVHPIVEEITGLNFTKIGKRTVVREVTA